MHARCPNPTAYIWTLDRINIIISYTRTPRAAEVDIPAHSDARFEDLMPIRDLATGNRHVNSHIDNFTAQTCHETRSNAYEFREFPRNCDFVARRNISAWKCYEPSLRLLFIYIHGVNGCYVSLPRWRARL